ALAPPAAHTLSLHDALPIYSPLLGAKAPITGASSEKGAPDESPHSSPLLPTPAPKLCRPSHRSQPFFSSSSRPDTCTVRPSTARSEEHTSELQSRENLVCRL